MGFVRQTPYSYLQLEPRVTLSGGIRQQGHDPTAQEGNVSRPLLTSKILLHQLNSTCSLFRCSPSRCPVFTSEISVSQERWLLLFHCIKTWQHTGNKPFQSLMKTSVCFLPSQWYTLMWMQAITEHVLNITIALYKTAHCTLYKIQKTLHHFETL